MKGRGGIKSGDKQKGSYPLAGEYKRFYSHHSENIFSSH